MGAGCAHTGGVSDRVRTAIRVEDVVQGVGFRPGSITLHADRVAGPYQALRLRMLVENLSTPVAELTRRADGLRYAMIAAHALIGAPGGSQAGDQPTERRGTMITRLVKAALLAAALAAIVQSIPDIKRYLELRDM
jgi:hypothetical protein